jgi:hypothetical protein
MRLASGYVVPGKMSALVAAGLAATRFVGERAVAHVIADRPLLATDPLKHLLEYLLDCLV